MVVIFVQLPVQVPAITDEVAVRTGLKMTGRETDSAGTRVVKPRGDGEGILRHIGREIGELKNRMRN